LRCPDKEVSYKMLSYLEKIRMENDSAGGMVSCRVMNVPVGLGEPVFDKLEADLAKAMMSIGAAKGFEYGSGFGSARLKGSDHNDEVVMANGNVATKTNHAGGIQGGISNGNEINFRVAFKPVSSIGKMQKTVDHSGDEVNLKIEGRHDVCIVPRAVPVVEAMTALVLADHLLRARTLSSGRE